MSEKIELGLFAAGQPLERFLGAVRDARFEAELVKHARRELGDQRIVLDDQHASECMHAVRLLSAAGRHGWREGKA